VENFGPIERPVGLWTENGKGKGKKKPLKILDKPLLNTADVAEQLDKVIERNCRFSGTLSTRRWVCGITFEEVKDEEQLIRACEGAKCTFKASEKGLRQWYAGATTSARRRLCPSGSGPTGIIHVVTGWLISNWCNFILGINQFELSLLIIYAVETL